MGTADEILQKLLNGIWGFVGAGLGLLFIFLLKDFFESRFKKIAALEGKQGLLEVEDNTLKGTITKLTEELKKNTEALEKNDEEIRSLNESVKIITKLEVDFNRFGSKFRRVVKVVEKLSGAPIPAEEPEI